jgi:hypothetical protein
MSCVREVLRLIPARTLLIVALGVLAGGWISLGRLATPPLLGWAALAAVGFGAAGLVLNSPAARAADPVGRGAAEGSVFAGVLVGTIGALLVGGTAVLIAVAALAVMIAYPPLKRRGPLGHLALALLTGLPLMYGAVAVDRAADGAVPWTLVAWLQLVRAVVADIAVGRSRAVRLSAALALGFVPASLVLPVRAGYGLAYFLVAVFAQLTVLVAAARLIVGRVDRVDLLLKGAMVMVLVALVVGRVA